MANRQAGEIGGHVSTETLAFKKHPWKKRPHVWESGVGEQKPLQKCNYCGGLSHPRSLCRAKNPVCYRCQVKGYFASTCLKKVVNEVTQSESTETEMPQEVFLGALDTVEGTTVSKKIIPILVNGISIPKRVANSSQALQQIDDENDIEDSIRDTITRAVNEAMQGSVDVTSEVNLRSKDTTTRGAKKSASKIDGAMIGDLVAQVVGAIQPILTAVVTAAVSASTKEILAKIEANEEARKSNTRDSLTRVRQRVQLQEFALDKLEQYTRRENVRIHGVPEPRTAGGETEDTVIKLAADIGVNINREDISVSHRLPGRQGKPKPMIVKFVRRDTKTNLMKNKQKLKNVAARKGVYISDDLTPLRAKLVREMKNDAGIKSVWTTGGRINGVLNDRTETKVTIDSPEHLLRVGWSEEKIKDLGIYFDM